MIEKTIFQLQACGRYRSKIKIYCYSTRCIFRTECTQSLIHVERCILYIFSGSCVASHSIAFRWISRLPPPLERLSVLPRLSISESRGDASQSIAIRAIILPRARAARFYAMPSVTIVVELSHTFDLMDSRRLLRPRPSGLVEISSSSYPTVATSTLGLFPLI